MTEVILSALSNVEPEMYEAVIQTAYNILTASEQDGIEVLANSLVDGGFLRDSGSELANFSAEQDLARQLVSDIVQPTQTPATQTIVPINTEGSEPASSPS